MVTFKKREIVYRPYEPYLKLITDVIMIVCLTYLAVTLFFSHITVAGYSMNDSLKDGNEVFVNKAAYRISGPERYDLIVFEPEVATVSDLYIKRVIGLPGETVQIIDGKIYIDGARLEDDVISTQIYNAGLAAEPVKLEYNQYFVLGDNRNNSDDSRFSNVGLVSHDSIIGKPWLIMYPISDFGTIKAKETE